MYPKDKHFVNSFRHTVLDTIEGTTYTLDALCQSLYISRSQLHRRIKSITGLSTTHYIRKIRLEVSIDLLRNTDKKVGEIASIVGINSPANFSKYFKNEYGLSPSEFKKSGTTTLVVNPKDGL